MGAVPARVGTICREERTPRVGGGLDVAGGEVGEKRVFTRPAAAVAGVALRLAAEQVVARLLLRRKLCLAGEHGIVLRGKGCYLGGGLVAGYRLRHLIECRGGPAAIHVAEMYRHWIVGGWRARLVTDLLHVARPLDCEGLVAPNPLEQTAVRPLRSTIKRARCVRQAHFHGVCRGTLRLIGGRLTQSSAGRTAVPKNVARE